MNKEHPEDNAQSRFTAFWMIVISLLVFVAGISFILWFNSSNEDAAANQIESGRAKKRAENLVAVNQQQRALISQAEVVDKTKNLVRIPVKAGMKLVLPELRKQKAAVSKVVVPGSPTSLKAAQVKPAATEKKAPEAAKAETAKAAPEKAAAAKAAVEKK
ncbi:MAG: hypothetical protein L3J39_17685 [Verrucomicrobiales bacterium]|nr:hypothetical protein [Verrucomicrobiales bacterium]